MTDNPTVAVLVHGGTFTSTMWDAVRDHLSVPSLAVDLPGRRYKPADLADVTLDDWVVSVSDDIAEAGLTDIALVGHSSGGYVIPGVATRLSEIPSVRLHSLIFVAATVPAEGKRPVDYLREDLRDLAIDHRQAVLDGARGHTLGGLRVGEAPYRDCVADRRERPPYGVGSPRSFVDRVHLGWVSDGGTPLLRSMSEGQGHSTGACRYDDRQHGWRYRGGSGSRSPGLRLASSGTGIGRRSPRARAW